MLPGKNREVLQLIQLVAIHARAVGEAAEDLVSPPVLEPRLRRGIGESLELPARSPHVRRRPEDDRVCHVERRPALLGELAGGIDRERRRLRSLCDRVRDARRVTKPGVRDDDDARTGIRQIALHDDLAPEM